MTTATETAHIVTPAALAAVLGDDNVLIWTRKLLEARLRRQALYAAPNEDSAVNGQPHARRAHAAEQDAREALQLLTAAADRAANRYVREEVANQ